MPVYKYFPESSNSFLLEKINAKIDFATEILSIANTDLSQVQFIKKHLFMIFIPF